MAVDSLQKAAEAAAAEGVRKGRGRPFAKGQSGNPAGRACGSSNKSTLAAELLLEGEAEALTRKAIELALAGNPTALKLCFDGLHPRRRQRAVRIELPPLKSSADIGPFMAAVAAAIADGSITPGEAAELAQMVETAIRAIAGSEKAARRAAFEKAPKWQPPPHTEAWATDKF